jgi:hypothetical protein
MAGTADLPAFANAVSHILYRSRLQSVRTLRDCLTTRRARMTDNDLSVAYGDWTFHQATGMVAAQLETTDMEHATQRLVTLAAQREEPVTVTASLVVDRHLRLSECMSGSATARTSAG